MGIKGAATLFANAGRRDAQHRDHGENDRAGGNLDGDVAAQLPECVARDGSRLRPTVSAGVSQSRLTAASASIKRNSAILTIRRRP